MFSIALFFGSPMQYFMTVLTMWSLAYQLNHVILVTIHIQRHVTYNSDSNKKKYTHNNKAA